jgi:hypothetical protein
MASLAWGGFSNGKIPVSALGVAINYRPLAGQPVGPLAGYMAAQAAHQWAVMDAHYFATTGRHLTLSEGYRSYADQESRWNTYQRYRSPLAAYPGTSLHGWGLSADVGVEGRAWMTANGARFGWHPTGKSFASPEPWHFDYLGGGDITMTPGQLQAASGSSKPVPILIPTSNGDNMIQMQLNKPDDKQFNGFIVDVAPGYIHHAGTMQEATVTMQVTSNPDERHILGWEDFTRVLLGHGIDRQFFEGGTSSLAKLDAAPWGGLWSQERANSYKLDAILGKLK